MLGPSAGWPMRERVDGVVKVIPSVTPKAAEMRDRRVLLKLSREHGDVEQLEADHVIAATGYRVDLRLLPFLNQGLASRIRVVEHMPELTGNFESSVPGLYFVGISSALSFGPMMRFAYGSAYTARRLERHLARHAERRSAYDKRATATV
jgi:thioredoxin reductase